MFVLERDAGIEIRLEAMRGGGVIPDADLRTVVDGVAQEDMLPVTVDVLRGSYAATAAYDITDSENPRIVGFARQVERHYLPEEVGSLCLVELGTVWVDRAERGRQIGPKLIQHSTLMMQTVDFIPVAVCNELSQKTFRANGYKPVGVMPNAPNGHSRIAMMNQELRPGHLVAQWQNGLREQVLGYMSGLPRFEDMRPLDAVE